MSSLIDDIIVYVTKSILTKGWSLQNATCQLPISPSRFLKSCSEGNGPDVEVNKVCCLSFSFTRGPDVYSEGGGRVTGCNSRHRRKSMFPQTPRVDTRDDVESSIQDNDFFFPSLPSLLWVIFLVLRFELSDVSLC